MVKATRRSTGTNNGTNKLKLCIKVKKADPLTNPVVVSFPGGVPEDDNPKFLLRRVREKAKRGMRILGKDSTCNYEGSNNGRGYDGRRTKLCVGVYNKTKGTVTLYPAAERGHVFSLEQSIQEYTSSDVITSRLTAQQRRKALFEDFGSSRKKRILKSEEANKVKVDAVVGAGSVMTAAFQGQTNMSESNRKAIEEAMHGEKTDAVAEAYQEVRRERLPPFHEDATKARDVYKDREMFEKAWDVVFRRVDAHFHKNAEDPIETLTKKKQGNNKWNPVVLTILKSIKHVDQDNVKSVKKKVRICMILNFLLFFFNKKTLSIRGSVTEISKSMSLPKDVCQEFLNIFTEKSAKNLYRATKQDNDKCMIYILILYVMANSPSTIQVSDVKPISRELKLEISKTSNMLREAGFTVAKKGASTGAVLNVPLTFPPPKRRGRGGK